MNIILYRNKHHNSTSISCIVTIHKLFGICTCISFLLFIHSLVTVIFTYSFRITIKITTSKSEHYTTNTHRQEGCNYCFHVELMAIGSCGRTGVNMHRTRIFTEYIAWGFWCVSILCMYRSRNDLKSSIWNTEPTPMPRCIKGLHLPPKQKLTNFKYSASWAPILNKG